jgi:formyl-CoA transferase
VFNLMESLVPEFDVAGVVRVSVPAVPSRASKPSNTYTTATAQNTVVAGNGDAIHA